MAGHAQLKFVMMECSKTQIRWRDSFVACDSNVILLKEIPLHFRKQI